MRTLFDVCNFIYVVDICAVVGGLLLYVVDICAVVGGLLLCLRI